MNPVWRIRLAQQAELDLFGITVWTLENFGDEQAQKYAETLSLAIEALEGSPEIMGAIAREDMGPGIRILHVARQGRKGRHFLVFRAAPEQTMDVLRLLHDNMDLTRHVSPSQDT
jgi:toxin ParE1/3/4